MKKLYEEVEIVVTNFNEEDVITTSNLGAKTDIIPGLDW